MGKNKFLLIIFLVIGFAGCASISNKENETPLKSADAFYKALSWKYYDKATSFIHPDYIKSYEKFVLLNKNDFNITNYEIRGLVPSSQSKKPKKSGEKVNVKVIITYYKYPSVTEKTVETIDTWTKENKRWFIKKDFNNNFFSN